MPPFASKPELGSPVLGSGTLVTIAEDSPAARAFIDFLETPLAHEIWMAAPNSAFLSALTTANLDVYSSPALRQQGEILTNATTFRFDASDLMPGPIGAGAFWTGIVALLNGTPAADVTLQIQNAWNDIRR
jgi:alpha-glucoside transport system substrate-binding protein